MRRLTLIAIPYLWLLALVGTSSGFLRARRTKKEQKNYDINVIR